MAQRWKTAGLALAILVFGLGLIVAVTGYEAGVDAAGPRLLRLSDVVQALEDQRIVADPRTRPASHPLLGSAGTALTVGGSSIEVYVYSSVAARVVDEQIVQRHLMQLQALSEGAKAPPRVTSARNLLLFDAASTELAASIHDAARSLALDAAS